MLKTLAVQKNRQGNPIESIRRLSGNSFKRQKEERQFVISLFHWTLPRR